MRRTFRGKLPSVLSFIKISLFLSSTDETGRWVMPLPAVTSDLAVKAVGVQRWGADPHPARPPTLANLCIFTVALVVSIQALSWCTLGVGLTALRDKVACLSNIHTAVNHSKNYSYMFTQKILALCCRWGPSLRETRSASHTLIAVLYSCQQTSKTKNKKKKQSNVNERKVRGQGRLQISILGGGRDSCFAQGHFSRINGCWHFPTSHNYGND